MNYVLPYLMNYSCKFPHQQVFTHLEISSDLSLVHVLWVLPCMLRSGLALLVSLWDSGVYELNLLWSDNTSDVFVTQVPFSIKHGFVDALVPKSSKDCKAFRHLMVARCPMVRPLFFLFFKYVITCTYLDGLLCKKINTQMAWLSWIHWAGTIFVLSGKLEP